MNDQVFILFFENNDTRCREFMGVYADANGAQGAVDLPPGVEWESRTYGEWTAELPGGDEYTIETHHVQ